MPAGAGAGVHVHKFDRVFTWFDQGGDGSLTREDFDQMAAMFTRVADEDDHENRSKIENAVDYWWELMVTAADGAEQIDRQQFIEIMQSIVTAPANFERAVSGISDGVLAALDRDKSGTLSQAEYADMYDRVGISRDAAAEAFGRLDRNGSGQIDDAEFRQAVVEFYLSSDPDAPGNWLLGAMPADA